MDQIPYRSTIDTQTKISIMQGWIDGKTIEIRTRYSKANTIWTKIFNENEPIWNWEDFDYRITIDESNEENN